jgi:hypothetical protein
LKRIVVVAGGGLALATLAGCGGAPGADYPAPVGGSSAGLGSLEDAEQELDVLERRLGLSPADEPLPAETSGAVSPAAPVHPESLSQQSRCETACDALASMGRAASRVCAMSGPGDRCARAESRVARAREHVTSTCGECS